MLVTNVTIEHRLSTGAGHADLDVPGIDLRAESPARGAHPPDRGRGRAGQRHDQRPRPDRLDGGGKVTSTGDFSTANLDLAAPFGPVTGMSGTIHFTDLLGLTTPPGQVLTVKSINPGILVENGVIRYQLLPNQLVKIERGEWPFMGGRLILDETVLNFGQAERQAADVRGRRASTRTRSCSRSASRSWMRPARSTACCR